MMIPAIRVGYRLRFGHGSRIQRVFEMFLGFSWGYSRVIRENMRSESLNESVSCRLSPGIQPLSLAKRTFHHHVLLHHVWVSGCVPLMVKDAVAPEMGLLPDRSSLHTKEWCLITTFTCSRCGYTRDSVEPVIEHIVDAHAGDGYVMEHESDGTTPESWIERLLG